ncbi:hypothetical protein ID866_7894 [Astraeus odoratus]|nr:hypothetical protein ID866_7894 [Astraeus odoratus]
MPAPTLSANKSCCSSSCACCPSTSAAATVTSIVLNVEKYVGVDVHDHFVAWLEAFHRRYVSHGGCFGSMAVC